MKEYVEDYGEFLILFLFCAPIAAGLFYLADKVTQII